MGPWGRMDGALDRGGDRLSARRPVCTITPMPVDPHRGADGPPLVGRVLGGTYEVERPLGAGGMGAVYVARHGRTGRRYAVKILLRERALTDEGIRRFRREAKALGALGHAGIIAVHDFVEEGDGLAYIVMDLLEG